MRSKIPPTHRRHRPKAVEQAGEADLGGEIAPGVRLIVGNCLDVLPTLNTDPARTVIITDPPWPEAPKDLLAEWGVDDCAALLRASFEVAAKVARRLAIIVGCSTDPRVLAVPESLAFVRIAWLRYALPSPRGTILNSGDCLYVFGSRESAIDMTLLPGECTAHVPRAREGEGANMHPTARRLEHMRWIVRHYTQPSDLVIDPFAGSGTTLLAARDAGRQAIGIERLAKYVPGIRARFRQQMLPCLDPAVLG